MRKLRASKFQSQYSNPNPGFHTPSLSPHPETGPMLSLYSILGPGSVLLWRRGKKVVHSTLQITVFSTPRWQRRRRNMTPPMGRNFKVAPWNLWRSCWFIPIPPGSLCHIHKRQSGKSSSPLPWQLLAAAATHQVFRESVSPSPWLIENWE